MVHPHLVCLALSSCLLISSCVGQDEELIGRLEPVIREVFFRIQRENGATGADSTRDVEVTQNGPDGLKLDIPFIPIYTGSDGPSGDVPSVEIGRRDEQPRNQHTGSLERLGSHYVTDPPPSQVGRAAAPPVHPFLGVDAARVAEQIQQLRNSGAGDISAEERDFANSARSRNVPSEFGLSRGGPSGLNVDGPPPLTPVGANGNSVGSSQVGRRNQEPTNLPSEIDEADIQRRKQLAEQYPLRAEPIGDLEDVSCDKQPIRTNCEFLNRRVQWTIRWFLHESGQCRAYIWGHCKWQGINNEPTLRTKELCEQVCIPPFRSRDP